MPCNPDLSAINHFIDRKEARRLITAYKARQNDLINPAYLQEQEEYGILPCAEGFNAASLRAILDQPGCEGIRIHFGLKDDKEKGEDVPLVVTVLVGVDKEGKNMWSEYSIIPGGLPAPVGDPEDGVILEDGQRCPPCTDPNPLP